MSRTGSKLIGGVAAGEGHCFLGSRVVDDISDVAIDCEALQTVSHTRERFVIPPTTCTRCKFSRVVVVVVVVFVVAKEIGNGMSRKVGILMVIAFL